MGLIFPVTQSGNIEEGLHAILGGGGHKGPRQINYWDDSAGHLIDGLSSCWDIQKHEQDEAIKEPTSDWHDGGMQTKSVG